jgi:hypothetical protein
VSYEPDYEQDLKDELEDEQRRLGLWTRGELRAAGFIIFDEPEEDADA